MHNRLCTHSWLFPFMVRIWGTISYINTLGPRQHDQRFAGDSFKSIFSVENVSKSVQILLKSVPKSSIENRASLNRRTSWIGDNPLTEPMEALFTDVYMHHSTPVSLIKMLINCDRKSSAVVSITVFLQYIWNMYELTVRVIKLSAVTWQVKDMVVFIN